HQGVRVRVEEIGELGREVLVPIDEYVRELVDAEQDRRDDEPRAQYPERLLNRIGSPAGRLRSGGGRGAGGRSGRSDGHRRSLLKSVSICYSDLSGSLCQVAIGIREGGACAAGFIARGAVRTRRADAPSAV